MPPSPPAIVRDPEDTAFSGNLPAATDVDGDALTYAAGSTAPAHGTVVVHSDGSFTYTPTANFNGSDFTYAVSDGTEAAVETTMTVTVAPVNDAPVDGNETNTTNEDTTLTVADGATGDLLNNATDVDGNPLTITADLRRWPGRPFTVGTPFLISGVGTLTVNANGSYTFAPAANYNGAVPVITYTVSDGQGGSDTSTLP